MNIRFLPVPILLLVLLASVAIFSGCFPSAPPDIKELEDSELTTDILKSDHLKTTILENVNIDADIEIPDQKTWPTLEVALKEFTDSEIAAFLKLLPNHEITEEHEMKSAYVSEYMSKNLMFPDGASMAYDAGSLLYRHPAYMERDYENEIMDTAYFLRDDLGEIYTKETIPNLKKETAIAAVRDAATALGLSVADVPQVYALDYETMASRWEDYLEKDGMPAEPWHEDEGAYVVIFTEQFDGLPVTNKGYLEVNQTLFLIGGRIKGVFSKDGLICLACDGIYTKTGQQDEGSFIPLKTALSAVAKKYEDIILTDPIDIVGVRGELVPYPPDKGKDTIRLIPAWVFSCKQTTTVAEEKGDSSMTSFFPVIINGIDGSEVQIGGAL